MSLDIIDASPSVGAYRCEPMTAAEIDAHPDRDRIWATIAALRIKVAEEADKAIDDAIEDGEEIPGTEREWRDYRIQVRAWKQGAEGFPDSDKRPARPS